MKIPNFSFILGSWPILNGLDFGRSTWTPCLLAMKPRNTTLSSQMWIFPCLQKDGYPLKWREQPSNVLDDHDDSCYKL